MRDWVSANHTVPYTDRDDTGAALQGSTDEIVQAIGRYPEVDRLLVDLLLTQRAWIDGWAAPTSELSGAIRASDTAYRHGGEEFAVLVREGDRSAVLDPRPAWSDPGLR